MVASCRRSFSAATAAASRLAVVIRAFGDQLRSMPPSTLSPHSLSFSGSHHRRLPSSSSPIIIVSHLRRLRGRRRHHRVRVGLTSAPPTNKNQPALHHSIESEQQALSIFQTQNSIRSDTHCGKKSGPNGCRSSSDRRKHRSLFENQMQTDSLWRARRRSTIPLHRVNTTEHH